MRPSRWLITLLLVLAGAGPVPAQSLEGTMKERTITVRGGTLMALMGDVDWSDDMAEVEWLRAVGVRLFAIPGDQLATGPEEDVDVQVMTLQVRAGALRFEGAGGLGYVLYDPAARQMTMVSPARKAYARVSMDELSGRARAMDEAMAGLPEPGGEEESDGEETPLRVRALGRKAVIAGQPATAHELTASGLIAVGWCGERLDDVVAGFRRLAASMGFGEEDDDEEAPEGRLDPSERLCPGSMPIRLQEFEAPAGPGESIYRMTELVSLDRTPVPASLFTIPAGFRAVTLEQFWGLDRAP